MISFQDVIGVQHLQAVHYVFYPLECLKPYAFLIMIFYFKWLLPFSNWPDHLLSVQFLFALNAVGGFFYLTV
uniref:Uncharacterized protein n=1 Tax=Rhizophora mucronata TaxID=61149 RepID=A0A2P2NV45_RHIMU